MARNRRSGVEDRWRKADGTPSALNGKGSRWRARYVDDDGRERAKAFARKADAQRWLDAEVTAKLATGTYIAPEAGKVTVASVRTAWSAAQGHIAPRTAGMRRGAWMNRVEPVWGHVAVVDVKTTAVKAWVATMVAGGLGAATIENAFSVLRQVMGAALEDNRIPRNPCDGVQLPKRRHADRGYLTHVQVAALAAAVDYLPEVVRFLTYTGLRWGEMAALRVTDFDMLRRRVNVSRSVTEFNGLVWSTPKSSERRSVPFPAALADELSALMVGKGREDLVFTTTRGGVLRASNYRGRFFGPAVERCQSADGTFPTITPHDLRHTAVSLAVSAGANVKAVQRMVGHAKASMTLDVYADLFDDDLDSVADSLDAAIKSAADPLRTGSGQ
jgi:integrase